MKITVIKNESAGGGKAFPDEINLKKLLIKYDLKGDIIDVGGKDISKEVRNAVNNGSEVIAAAGGDGTVSAAAGVLVNTGIPLAVIPSGTLNHFAKDAGIPLDKEEAVKVIKQKLIKRVDIGEVNGKFFINNSSVGLYPKIVKFRDREMKNTGSGKWIAMGRAFLTVFHKMPVIDVKIKSDLSKTYCITPFVFIGNNEYQTDLFNAGVRENLTGGKLSLFYPTWAGRFTLLRYAFLALINKLKDQKDFHTIDTEEIKIETTAKELEVAVDGEVFHMNTPLLYRLHPLALQVIVPGDKQ